MANKNKGLGKGFGSLLPDDFDNSILLDKEERINKVVISDIKPNPNQPRKHFDEAELDELSASIKTYGLLQPIVLSPDDNGYIIIAGERRFRAAQKAGLKELPALVRTLKELERLEIGLVENVQRVDLSPLEQALSILRLNEQFNMSYQDIAKKLGKAETTVVNIVRLLQLPDSAREALGRQKITEGHARSILALKGNPKLQEELLKKIIENGWSVRQAEQFASDIKSKKGKASNRVSTIFETESSKNLTTKLGSKVNIRPAKKGGRIEISYKSAEELKRIIGLLIK